MNLLETILELRSLEVDHETVPASQCDLTSEGTVRTALGWGRNVTEITNVSISWENYFFYYLPVYTQIPHHSWLILLDNPIGLRSLLLNKTIVDQSTWFISIVNLKIIQKIIYMLIHFSMLVQLYQKIIFNT